MKAVVFEEFKGSIQIKNVPSPTPAHHGVVLKIKATGMCLSDWHGWQGHDADIVLPHVPGHELAGEIVEIERDVKSFKIGDCVTVPFVRACGSCYQCYSGNHRYVIINRSQGLHIGALLQNT